MSEKYMGNILLKEAFQKSVNIRYDYGDEAKVQDYIASSDSLDLLGKLVWSTANGVTNRANILIGAYGRGKSHLILVLLTLLCSGSSKSCSSLLSQIKQHDMVLYEYLIDYITNQQRLLPVIISGNSVSISQSFLAALQEALQRENLASIMPETHFTAALNMIEKWKKEYPETYKQFNQLVAEPMNEYCAKLDNFEEDAYKKFVAMYPLLTAGSEFNPFLGFDIVELYSSVIEKLTDFGYMGIYVIYDEFSKYLEANIKEASIVDIKLLQDFAEKCTRSGHKQMHLLLITHKDIHNYIDLLPKEKTDGWRGIAERFEYLEMNGNVEQTYELIGTVIQKEKNYYENLKQQYANEFLNLTNMVHAKNLFPYYSYVQVEHLIDVCYPLHPVTVFLLPRISEKVAQNERTLFTFLASNQKNTLKEFLETQFNGFQLLTPDYIYDYFEQQFKKEAYQTEIHKIYITTAAALKKVKKGSLHEKAIKTIALLLICNEPDVIPSNDETLSLVYSHAGYSNVEIAETLRELVKEIHLLYQRENNGFLELKSGSQHDVDRMISDTVEKIKVKYALTDILNHAMLENYFYPTRYNEDYAVTRYFKFVFITEYALYEDTLLDDNLDGMIYGIIPEREDTIKDIKQHLLEKTVQKDRKIFILLKDYQDIVAVSYRYQAILTLKEQCKNDIADLEELLFQQEDLETVLRNYFFQYTMPEQLKADYYYHGKRQEVYRKTQFTNLLSKICEDSYYKTPIINNEMINKDMIEKSIISARNKIVTGLLESFLDPMLGLTGNGPEVSLTRVLLVNTGVLEETENGLMVRTYGLANENLQYVFNTIQNFLRRAGQQKGQNFELLYNQLILPEYHIGLKKGVIPVLLAAVLHSQKTQIIIEKDGKEVELSAELLVNVNENPKAYTVSLESWSEEKQQYIEQLEDIFAEFIETKEKEFNGFSYVAKAVQRWFLSLPKVTKNMTFYFDVENHKFVPYTTEMLRFVELLRNPELGVKKFLFESLPTIFSTDDLETTIIQQIADTKYQFDRVYRNLIEGMLCSFQEEFFVKEYNWEMSFQSVLEDWWNLNQDKIAAATLTNQQERMINILQQDATEYEMIQQLGKQIVGLRVADWKNEHVLMFKDALKDLKQVVEQTEEVSSNAGQDSLADGSIVELSHSGQMLLKDLQSLLEDDYGEAVSNREKRTVLTELLKKL